MNLGPKSSVLVRPYPRNDVNGNRDAVLFDTYVLPPYARYLRPVEPGFVECLVASKPNN
jgi:hypothetical protein